jgi:hypothetical protein
MIRSAHLTGCGETGDRQSCRRYLSLPWLSLKLKVHSGGMTPGKSFWVSSTVHSYAGTIVMGEGCPQERLVFRIDRAGPCFRLCEGLICR